MKLYNFKEHRNRYKSYFRREINLNSKPIIENIELISNCNLKCKMCIKKPNRSSRILSFKDLRRIVNANIQVLKGESVWIHHYGESLLHPDLTKIIKYLVSRGINPRLSTNCTLLTKSISKKLIKSGLDEIVFSIDTLNPQKFNYYRGGNYFDKSMNNVINFLAIKEKLHSKKPVTQVQCIDIDLTKKEINDYISFWSKTQVNWINIKKPSTRGNLVVSPKINFKIRKRLGLFQPLQNKLPCFWLWSSLVILSNGNVVTCCGDLAGINIVGNVFKNSILEIWNSEKMKKIREEQCKGEYNLTPLCKFCPELIGYTGNFKEFEKRQLLKSKNKRIKFNHHVLIENVKEI